MQPWRRWWDFFWTVSAAGGFDPADDSDYYNLLVRGYRKSHLYLDQAPAPEMLTLADPYDSAQNGPYRLPDATYFQGHYYLYFGAAPAVLLLWPYAVITGRALPMGAAVWVFCVIEFLAASGVRLAWRRRYFPASSAWTGVSGILVLGFATHVLALARRSTSCRSRRAMRFRCSHSSRSIAPCTVAVPSSHWVWRGC